jgi:RND family efflux transporter MFP subunit
VKGILAMKKGFLFKSTRVFVVLAVAIIVAVLLIVLRPRAERQERTEIGRLVEVFQAKPETFNMVIETYGTIQPREILKLVAQVNGEIIDLHPEFKEGNFVTQGTVLIQIDPRTYALEVERRYVEISKAEAESAKFEQEVANLGATEKIALEDKKLAQKEFTRLKTLATNNVIAKSTLDAAEQKYLASVDRLQRIENQIALTDPIKRQLAAQLNMARVLWQQAKLDLERTRITVPFNGWVLEKAIEKGQHVVNSQFLGRVYKDGELDIEARIPLEDFKWLPEDVDSGDHPVAEITLTRERDSEPTWTGRVTRVKAQMDEKTRTLPVIVELDRGLSKPQAPAANPYGAVNLRPGMFVTVRITGRAYKDAFVLERHVVHAGDVVYTVSNGHLQLKPVRVLRRYKNLIYIDDGLADGDLIVKSPLSVATEGMPVRVQE